MTEAIELSTGNLTVLELAGLDATCNVADGHARQDLTASQTAIVAELPDLFAEARATPVDVLEQRAQHAFLTALGQHHAPVSARRVRSCYSSSVAMEILARALHSAGVRTVALVHPTFDNIPDILRGVGLDLRPVPEAVLLDGEVGATGDAGAVFITTPNNPTGIVLPADRLARWARHCARHDRVLALDTSFRGFDPRAQYDHYQVLDDSGCRYVIIEDTGKLWPMLDLKVGFLAYGERLGLPLDRIYTDILLGVSPFLLRLVERLAGDAATGGLAELSEFVGHNRSAVRAALSGLAGVAVPDPDSRISVERVRLPAGITAGVLWAQLREREVHVLPCGMFHWAEPAAGDRFIRVSLARRPVVVEAAAAAIRERLAGPAATDGAR